MLWLAGGNVTFAAAGPAAGPASIGLPAVVIPMVPRAVSMTFFVSGRADVTGGVAKVVAVVSAAEIRVIVVGVQVVAEMKRRP
jgi:hypothetical protein